MARPPDAGLGVPTPAVVGGAVLFGGGFGSHEIYAVDAATGQRRWQQRTNDDGPTAAAVLDGVALFNTESCTLLAVHSATGNRLWEKLGGARGTRRDHRPGRFEWQGVRVDL
jgi:outer membrane protein assembly factor BamB